MTRISITVLLAAAITCYLLFQHWQQQLAEPLNINEPTMTYQVEAGSSVRQIIDQLQHQGIIDNSVWLLAYLKFYHQQIALKAGEYQLQQGMNSIELITLLESGKVVQHSISIIEGQTLKELQHRLSQSEALSQTLPNNIAEWPQHIEVRLPSAERPAQHLEGLFYPDTYHVTRNTTDREFLQRAHNRLVDILQQKWRARQQDLPYETPYQALIMASIIEKETAVPTERPDIAGVFVRRMKKNMRLQTDPTVIYGAMLMSDYQGNIKRRHLNDRSNLYNTYQHNGLPPTPIAAAGNAAITAALQPASGDALFFVARGDGSHVFSKTLAEHQKAVRAYQLNRNKNYRSTPLKSSPLQ